MYLVVILVVIVIILVWYLYSKENYGVCNDCDNKVMPQDGLVVLNPFIWPYSGTPCINDLYLLNKDNGVDLGFEAGPMYHLTTPDHVAME